VSTQRKAAASRLAKLRPAKITLDSIRALTVKEAVYVNFFVSVGGIKNLFYDGFCFSFGIVALPVHTNPAP